MTQPTQITQENFQTEVLESKEPVLVDFHADWCGPCRAQSPIVERLAEEYAGRARIGKVDVDDEQELAARFGVRSIPTLIVFDEGKVVDQLVGAQSKSVLSERLDAALRD